MKKRLVMGPYTYHEDWEDWYSIEKVIEGTVRMVDDILCSATSDILVYDDPYFDMGRCAEITECKVIRWVPVTDTAIDST